MPQFNLKKIGWDIYDYFRLYLFAPENILFGVTLAALYGRRDWLSTNLSIKEHPQFWGSTISAVTTQVVMGFFGRLRENRDYFLLKDANQTKKDRESMDIFFEVGEKALARGEFFGAAQAFRKAREGYQALYTDTNYEAVAFEMQQVCYKEAFCLAQMAKLSEALGLIEILVRHGGKENIDALNLKATICFRLGKHDEAKKHFSESLKLNPGQNSIYLFQQYYLSKWANVMRHIPFVCVKSDEPFPIETLKPELGLIFGEACFEKGDYAQAIAMFDATMRVVPKIINYQIERVLARALYAKAVHQLFDGKTDETLKVQLANGEEITIQRNVPAELLQKLMESFMEAKEYMPEDPRIPYIEGKIEEIKSIIQPQSTPQQSICQNTV